MPIRFNFSDRLTKQLQRILKNNQKRKLLGNEIYEGFLNPKKIKIGTLHLNKQSSNTGPNVKKLKTEETEKPKMGKGQNTKHKFQFY